MNTGRPLREGFSVGVVSGLVALLDFKSSGGPEKSTVGSIPIYSRQKKGAGRRNGGPRLILSKLLSVISPAWADPRSI